VLFDTVDVITAYDCRESLLVTADYLFYAKVKPEQFYVEVLTGTILKMGSGSLEST